MVTSNKKKVYYKEMELFLFFCNYVGSVIFLEILDYKDVYELDRSKILLPDDYNLL